MKSCRLIRSLVLGGGLLLLASCSNNGSVTEYKQIEYSGGPNYKTYARNTGIGQFSVEYPIAYQINDHNISPELGTTSGPKVEIHGPNSEDYSPTLITIICYEKNNSLSDIDMAIQLATATNKILQKNNLIVSGIKAKEILFSSTLLPVWGGAPHPTVPVLEYEKRIFIANGNLIWEIDVSYDTSHSAQAQADFTHVLQTFKILN